MMNKAQFEQEKQRVIGLCKFRPIEGVIRFSNTEGIKHFDKKCGLCWAIEGNIVFNYHGGGDFPKWYKPCFFTEVRFKNGLRGDVVWITPEGTFDYEIASTESEKSLNKKEKLYEKMGIKMVIASKPQKTQSRLLIERSSYYRVEIPPKSRALISKRSLIQNEINKNC